MDSIQMLVQRTEVPVIAKCANPACPVRFDHRLGGKFYRFRREQGSEKPSGGPAAARNNSHNVDHFWLCARCCQVFSFVYVEGCGVLLKLVGEDRAAETKQDQFAAA
jgi:hypothetical protein